MTKKWGFTLVGLSLIFTLASAQTREQRLEAALKKYPEADTNKDGTLTQQEAMAYRAKMRSENRPAENSTGPTFHEWFGVKSLNLNKRKGPVQPSSDKEPPSEEKLALGLDASPITYLTKDDPPIYLLYNGPNSPVTETTLWGTWVHHPMLGIKLKEAMDAKDMECYLEYKDAPPVTAYESQYDFIIQKLKTPPEQIK